MQSSAIQIVTGLTSPEDIVVDATNIYFTDAGGNSVWQVNKSTLAKTRLGSTNAAKPWRIAVDATNVYWTSNQGGAIRTAPIGGGPGQTLYSANLPQAIAVDGTSVYWSQGSAVYKAPKSPDAGAAAVLTGAVGADELRIDSTSLFGWGAQSNGEPAVYAVDKMSGAATYYAAVPGANGTDTGDVAINSHTVFWLFTNYSGTGLPSLEDAPKGAPSSNVWILDNLHPIAYLAADDCSVYWTTGASGIVSATIAGGGARTLTTAASASHRLAVDDANVYWTDSTWVGRVPK
jgi:hypothetical protein